MPIGRKRVHSTLRVPKQQQVVLHSTPAGQRDDVAAESNSLLNPATWHADNYSTRIDRQLKQSKGMAVQFALVALLYLSYTVSTAATVWTVLLVIAFIAYALFPGCRAYVYVHSGGIPTLEGSFITPIARRKENLFICLPDGITAMWDGVVHEAPHRRATEASFAKKGMRKLGRIRALRTQQNKWVLQTSEAAKATPLNALDSPEWVTWYWCEGCKGAADQDVPPLTTSGASWQRLQPSSKYIGNRVPLFLADHEAVEDGTSLQQAGGRMKKKLTKDQKYVHKIQATSSDDALKGKVTSWSNLWLR